MVVIENVLVDKTNHVQLCQKVRQDIVVAENQFANTYAPERSVPLSLYACLSCVTPHVQAGAALFSSLKYSVGWFRGTLELAFRTHISF